MKIFGKPMQWFLLAVTLLPSVGCVRDPNVRKQKYFESGTHYFQKAKYPEAAIQFQNAIQIDRNFAAAHYQLAQCLLRQGLLPSAYQELQRTVDLEPKNWQAQIDLGNLLFGTRQFQDAKDRALSVLKENPGHLGAQLLLANSDNQLDNTQAAVEEAQQAVQLAPSAPAPYLTLGLLQEKLRQLPAAEQSLQKAVLFDPGFVPARLGLGGFYQRQKRWAEAETEFRAAIEADHNSALLRLSLASLYVAWGRIDQAEQTLMDAKKAMPNDPAAYRMLGDFYLSRNDTAKALSEFASLFQQHPKDLAVKKRYIQLLILDKQFDQAMKLDGEILKQDSRDTEALTLKGQALNLQQKPAEAIPVLETAAKSNPEDPVGHSQLGVSYVMTGNVAGAEKEWREAVRLRPAMLDAQENLANLALRKGDFDLLRQSASAWLLYAPSATQGYLMRGTALLRKGDHSGAEKDFRRALEIDPRNPIASTRLGDVRLAQKRFVEAEKLYEQALEYNPRAGEALQGVVNLLLSRKQPEKALRRVEAQVAKVPDNSAYYLLLGETLLGNHKAAEAQAALEKSVELDKTNVSASLILAQVQGALGQVSQAATTYDRSIRENPRDVRLYIAYGVFQEKQGDWKSAQQQYEKALQVQADFAAAANNLSYLLLEHGGDTDQALSLAQIARRGMPDSVNTADTLAWAYYKKGIYKPAIDLLREATKEVPQNPNYAYHLGLVYQKADQPALARKYLQRALEIDPGFRHAEEIRSVLSMLAADK